MKEELKKLDPSTQKMFSQNKEIVMQNYKYMISIGIKDPMSLIPYIANMFFLPTEILAKNLKDLDVDLINEDPSLILDIL